MQKALPLLLLLPLAAASADAQGTDSVLSPVGRARISAVYDIVAVPPHAYALERGRIRVLDVRNPAAVRELAALELDAPRVRSLVHGSVLCVYGFGQPLGVVDISDPLAPRWIGNHPDLKETRAALLDPRRDLLFVLARRGDNLALEVLRLGRTAALPERMATLDLGADPPSEVTPMFLQDGSLYVIRRGPASPRAEVVRIDVSAPEAPAVTRRIPLPEGRRYNRLAVRDDLLYLVTRNPDGLAVHRMAGAAEPALLGSVTDPRLWYGAELILRGDALYVTFKGDVVLATFDVSDPTRPRLAHAFQPDFPASGLGMSLAGDRLYVSGDAGPSAILDVSEPLAPRYLGRWNYQGGWAADIALDGSVAIVLNQWFGVILLDLRDPTSPRRLAYHVARKAQPRVRFAAREHRILIAYDSLPAELLDVSRPDAPVVVRRFPLAEPATAVALTPSHAFLGGASGGLRVLDLGRSTPPASLGVPGTITDLATRGDRLLAAHADGALSLIDIARPAEPVVVGSVTAAAARSPPGATSRVVFSANGRRAIVATGVAAAEAGSIGLRIYDVAVDSGPRLLGTLDIPHDDYVSEFPLLATAGGQVLLAVGRELVHVDAGDPRRPAVVARYRLETTMAADGLALAGSHVLVGAAEDGVLVFPLPRGVVSAGTSR